MAERVNVPIIFCGKGLSIYINPMDLIDEGLPYDPLFTCNYPESTENHDDDPLPLVVRYDKIIGLGRKGGEKPFQINKSVTNISVYCHNGDYCTKCAG